MFRTWPAIALVCLVACDPALHADAFDRYTNPVLARLPGSASVHQHNKVTAQMLTENDHVLPGVSGAFLVVKTNEGRYSKLLVQAARQRVAGQPPAPVLMIDRFTTFREGQERTIEASGRDVRLFGDFRFNLDIGQVVPATLPADLHVGEEGGHVYLEPLGKAVLYLVTQPPTEAAPRKPKRMTPGEAFEPRFFNGTYKLQDDGRRSGTLTLEVLANGDVTGAFYSDKDGHKYEVNGKIGVPHNRIQFTIVFPRSQETFHGWLFTGDARAITGYARLQDREFGFYALRSDEE